MEAKDKEALLAAIMKDEPQFCPACGSDAPECKVEHVNANLFQINCECGMTCLVIWDDFIKPVQDA